MPVISAMGNLPIVKDLVVDMVPFWAEAPGDEAVPPAGLRPAAEDGKEYRIPQEQMNVIHKEELCINCGCCVSECNAMESDPEFLGPQALAKGMRFVGDPRDGATVERLEQYSGEHGIWECTRCFFCNERCPKGVDPRDAIAKLGAEAIRNGIDRDMGAKHAKWFVRSSETTGWLRETELVPKTQGVVSTHQADEVRDEADGAQQGGRRRSRRTSRRTSTRRGSCTSSCASRTARARSATCRASTRSRRLGHAFDDGRDPYGPGSFPRPYLPGEEEETT